MRSHNALSRLLEYSFTLLAPTLDSNGVATWDMQLPASATPTPASGHPMSPATSSRLPSCHRHYQAGSQLRGGSLWRQLPAAALSCILGAQPHMVPLGLADANWARVKNKAQQVPLRLGCPKFKISSKQLCLIIYPAWYNPLRKSLVDASVYHHIKFEPNIK